MKILTFDNYLVNYDKVNEKISDNSDNIRSHDVKNREFRKLMKNAGLENVVLCKGNGYFYITSDDAEMFNKITNLPDDMIYMNSFRQMTPAEWVEEIKRLLNQK